MENEGENWCENGALQQHKWGSSTAQMGTLQKSAVI